MTQEELHWWAVVIAAAVLTIIALTVDYRNNRDQREEENPL